MTSYQTEELFTKYKHLAAQTANRIFPNLPSLAAVHGMEEEDIIQIGLLSIWEALGTYDPSKSTLRTHLINNIKWTLQSSVGRLSSRTYFKRSYREENTVHLVSMDAPQAEGVTLHDTVGEESAYYHQREQVLLLDQVCKCIRPQTVDALYKKHIKDIPYCDIAKEYGISARWLTKKIERDLRIASEKFT